MGKLSEEEKKQWKELFSYVEKEILNYDDNQKLQKNAVLRIKGLENGKVFANNSTKDNGNYSPVVIMNTFKACKQKIMYAIDNKNFENEDRTLAYICAIVRGSLNDVYNRMKRVEKEKKSIDKIDTSIISNDIKAEYSKKSDCTDKFADMW